MHRNLAMAFNGLIVVGLMSTGLAGAAPIVPSRVDCAVESLRTYCDTYVNPYAAGALAYGQALEAYLDATVLAEQQYVEYVRANWATGEVNKVVDNIMLGGAYATDIANYTTNDLVPFLEQYAPHAAETAVAYALYLESYANSIATQTEQWVNLYDESDGRVVPAYGQVSGPDSYALIQLPPMPPPPPPMAPPSPPSPPPQPGNLPVPSLPTNAAAAVIERGVNLAWQAIGAASQGVHTSQAALASAQAPPVDAARCNMVLLNEDSDHDGLANALEIGLRDHVYGGKRSYDPCLWDSDGDGIGDGRDLDVLHARSDLGVKFSARLTQIDTMDDDWWGVEWGEPYIATSWLGNAGDSAQEAFYQVLDWQKLRNGNWPQDSKAEDLGLAAQSNAAGYLELLPADITKWKTPTSPDLSFSVGLMDKDASCDDVYGRPGSGHWGNCPATLLPNEDFAGFPIKLLDLVDQAKNNAQNPGHVVKDLALSPQHHVGDLHIDLTVESDLCSVSIAQLVANLQSGAFLKDGTAQCHP